MSALTDLFTAFANKIRSKTGGSDTYTPPQMVNAIDDVYQAGVDAGTTPTQTKTVTAGTSATTVYPDTGYALSSVTVNPTPSQSKSATPTTTAQTITPDSGKLLSSVSVGAIQTETKSDTPNVSTNKTVTPSSGKYLSQVTIQPLTHSGTYTPAANTAQNDMGAYHDKRYVNTSGMIVPSGNKAITSNGTGIDVSGYATASVSVSGTSITPSNSSPASMSSGSLYTPSASGYAISSYDNVTPTADGTYFSTGMKKMSAAGYAYSSKPTPTETTLWTNPSPTASFSSQAVTLSQSLTDFDYVKIKVYSKYGSGTSTSEYMMDVSVFTDLQDEHSMLLYGFVTNGYEYGRRAAYNRAGKVYFANAFSISGGPASSANANAVPTEIIGMKL